MKKIFLMLALGLLFSFNACFDVFAETLQTINDIKIWTLDNGQKVVIKENHSSPIVIINTWIHTGSINENDKNNGVAHFLEHLFFKGTKNYKRGEFEKILDSLGGVYNASTSKDFTQYYIKLPSKHFETAVNLHSDMLLNIAIPEDELEMERKVVIEEIKRSNNSPINKVYKQFSKQLFKVHPYKREVLGTEEIISNISRDEIFDFYNKWYQPSNMTTVVVGDVDEKQALKLIKEKFKTNKNIKVQPNVYKQEPSVTAPLVKTLNGDYNAGYIVLGYKTVAQKDKKDSYALDIASLVLGGLESSRLNQNIKEKKHLVTYIASGSTSYKDDGMFYLVSIFEPQNYEKVKQEMLAEVYSLRNTITEVEIQKAKNILERSAIYEQEQIEEVASSIGYNLSINKDISFWTDYVKEIKSITKKDIQQALDKYITPNKLVMTVLLPDGYKPVNNKTETLKKVKKAENNIKEVKQVFGKIRKLELPNGVNLLMDKNDSVDIVSFSAFVKGGRKVEKIAGIGDVLEESFLNKTKNRNNIQIAEELENSGVVLGISLNDDYFRFGFKSTKNDFEKGFEIFKDVFENSEFTYEKTEQAKKQILSSIKASKDTPKSVAFNEFYPQIYGSHPYGRGSKIIEKTIEKVDKSLVDNYYNCYFTPSNLVVSVSGSFDEQEIIDKFSALKPKCGKGCESNPFKYQQLDKINKNKAVKIAKDTETAWYIIGWQTDGYKSEKEYLTLKVINAILGNGMSSRLFVNLRENKGLAYEVDSSYVPKKDNGVFYMYIGTKPENLKVVEADMFQEIEKLKNGEVSEKELKEAKTKISGRWELLQETSSQRSYAYGMMEVMGKGYEYIYNYPKLIEDVSVQDIIEVAKKYFSKPYVRIILSDKIKADK